MIFMQEFYYVLYIPEFSTPSFVKKVPRRLIYIHAIIWSSSSHITYNILLRSFDPMIHSQKYYFYELSHPLHHRNLYILEFRKISGCDYLLDFQYEAIIFSLLLIIVITILTNFHTYICATIYPTYSI